MKPKPFIRRSTAIFACVTAGMFVALAIYGAVTSGIAEGLLYGVLATIPAAVAGWFVLSLVMFIIAKKKGREDAPALKRRLWVAAGLVSFLLLLIAALMGVFALAIQYM